MSFYNDASLVFLPSGGAGKDTKAYSIKPKDGSGDFTFSRGSNLTATRVDSNGLIEKGRENLLLQSNQFDTTWIESNASATNGQSGYDGSSDAWELESLSNGFYRRVSQSTTQTGVITFSIYAKASATNFLLIYNNQNGYKAWFDLSSGSLGNLSGAIDSSIEYIGNGYYRCSISLITSSTSQFWICPTNGNNVASCDLGNSIYIQDSQLEQGLVATEYIESGATTGLAGILEDSPRFDYSGGASCPSLLLEPSRTNLIGQSEYLNSHSKNNSTLVNFSNVTCPIEGIKVSKIIDNNSGGNGRIALFESVNLTASTTYTASIFAKADQLNFIYFSFDGAAVNSDKRVWFNLSTGQVGTESGSATGSIESFGDGWYRCIMVFTADNTGLVNTKIAPAEEDDNINVDRDGSSSVLATAMQLEEGSYPTSYIPNHSGGSVTRDADSFEKTGLSSLIGQTEGTIFFEFEYSHQVVNTPFFRILEDASNLYEIIALSSYKLRSRARIGGSIVAAIDTSSVVSEGTHKAAIIYKSNDYKFYLNGSLVGSSTENSIVSNPSKIDYFNNNNNLKQFLLFPTALSDNQCIALTS